VLSMIARYASGTAGREASWVALANDFAIPVVALIVAAAALRAVDLLMLRHRISAETARSEYLSAEIRGVLEDRFHGVTDRARQVDAADLVDRALGKDRRASAQGRPGSTAGA